MELINSRRRLEAGKIFMEIAKYAATIGLISGVLTKNITFKSFLTFVSVFGFLLILGLATIPKKLEE